MLLLMTMQPDSASLAGRINSDKYFKMPTHSHIQVVILAAGKGSRLFPLTSNQHKSLIQFNHEPLLVRTIRQLRAIGLTAIRVITGHLHTHLHKALAVFGNDIEFIHNEYYATDTNSFSLHLGLTGLKQSSVLVIEGDVVLSDACWPIIQNACGEKHSIWFTHGAFLPHQCGGIIKSDSAHNIIDMKIVSCFEEQYKTYSKNLGVVYIGPGEIDLYRSILEKNVAKSHSFYYMEHWIQHLQLLACKEIDLFSHPAASFNTLEELTYCQQYLHGA